MAHTWFVTFVCVCVRVCCTYIYIYINVHSYCIAIKLAFELITFSANFQQINNCVHKILHNFLKSQQIFLSYKNHPNTCYTEIVTLFGLGKSLIVYFYEQPEINGYILVRYEVMKPWRNILIKIENILNILDEFS